MNEKDFIKLDVEEIEPVELSDWEKSNIEKVFYDQLQPRRMHLKNGNGLVWSPC